MRFVLQLVLIHTFLLGCVFKGKQEAPPAVAKRVYVVEDPQIKVQTLLESTDLKDTNERITYFSSKLLGTRYKFNTFGEGPQADLHHAPRYQFFNLDCVTFVELVMALAISNDLERFEKTLFLIRYQNSKISYETRNHFLEIDWLKNVENKKIGKLWKPKSELKIKQVTLSGFVDKSNWYLKRLTDIKPKVVSDEAAQTKLEEFASRTGKIKFKLKYFKRPKEGFNPNFYKSIPLGAIIVFLYMPAQNLTEIVGSPYYVRHMGFVFQNPDLTILRSASAVYTNRKVIDESLSDYVETAAQDPNFLGVGIYTLTQKTN
jgi:hypothetical protein